MSLSLTLTETINEVLQTFISRVATEYNLDTTELQSLWSGCDLSSKPIKKTVNQVAKCDSKSPPQEIDPDVLLKCNKAELVALCKSHGYKCSGTKTNLMSRLLGKDDNTKEDTPKASKKPPAKSKAAKQAAVVATPVAQKLTANIPNILIRRNKYNNYEHPETGLVFDNETKIVYGKQNENGSVDPLTDEDIDQCNAFKFKFKIPKNLDQKSTLDQCKVDELSDEELEDDELEVEEEELAEEELEEDDLIGDDDEFEDYVSE